MADTTTSTASFTTSAHYAFALLGPLVVTRDAAEVPLGGRQQKAVLARLLVEPNTRVSTEGLMHALWGETVRDGAVTTIQTYISHLREALEPDRKRGARPRLLVTEPGGYLLRVDETRVDACVFERGLAAGRVALDGGRYDEAAATFARALSGWRGDVMPELADLAFVHEAAGRLEGLRVAAIEDRVEADLALGRCHRVVDELDRLVLAHPLRERLQGQRMLALYRCGRQAEALTAYQDLRETLATELGIDPTPDVQEIYLSMLRQDSRLSPPPPVDTDCGLASSAVAPQDERPAAATMATTSRRGRQRLLSGTAFAAVAALVAVTAASSGAPNSPHGDLTSLLAANAVGRFAPSDGIVSAVPVGQSPAGIAYGAGALWVTNEGNRTVSRVDPTVARVVQTIDVGSAPNAVAATGDDVWVANGGDGTVSRVNTHTNRVVQTIQVGNQPSAVTAGAGGVWVANTADDTVQRIDPTTGSPDPPIDVGGRPAGVAARGSTVWVTNRADGTVSRIDAGTGQAESPVTVGAGPSGIAASRQAVWVANSLDLSVSRLDPSTGRVEDVLRLGDGPGSVATGAGVVWVADEFDGRLHQLDPATNHVTHSSRLGGSLRALAVSGSSVWVASDPWTGAAHRGGTLTVEGRNVPGFDTIDPARSWLPATMTMAYDGLVASRRTGGTEGTTLVPDLATDLPRPTDGGRTYTFTVRRGIHYSDGRTVVPADLRRGFRRALAAGQRQFVGVVGAQRCLTHPAHCNLTRGVVTDPATPRITFHLTQPDPEFVAKLSGYVFATPPGVAAGEPPKPIPGTGPYRIVDHTTANRQHRLTMERNPYFRQWSFAAKPDGYPDRIVWHRVVSEGTRVADLLAAGADVSDPYLGRFSSGLVARLAREHPALLHVDPSMGTQYEWLNTRLPPFDDRRVRRALNFAVDRNRLVQLTGGPQIQVATCQILLSNSPGYHRYCPYTEPASTDGPHHDPRVTLARALVRASGTRGMTVVVPTAGPDETPVSRFFVRVLRTIGFRARIGLRDPSEDGPRPNDQLGRAWWSVDYVTPSDFVTPVLSCGSAHGTPSSTLNRGGFCDARVDDLAKRAQRLQSTDPGGARRLWARVDRMLTNDAPWVAGPATRFMTVVSSRVGNYQSHPVLGPLIDQLWVR